MTYHEHVAGDKHDHAFNGPHSHGGVSALVADTPAVAVLNEGTPYAEVITLDTPAVAVSDLIDRQAVRDIITHEFSGATSMQRLAVQRRLELAIEAAPPARRAEDGLDAARLRSNVLRLHHWDVSQGWFVFNAIVAEFDDILAARLSASDGATEGA